MWGAPRGRGRGFANRSLVRNAPAAAPSSSTPEGFVRRGNSLINVSALAAPPAAPRPPPPPAPQPPPIVAHPPLAAPPAAQLKYSFHQPARGRGGSGRGRRSPHYASPAWRPRGNAAHVRGALRGGGSLLSRALHHNRTLRRAPAAAPLASKIGKERAQVEHLVGGVRYRRAGRGGRSLLRVSAGGGDAAKRPHVQYVRSANGMALVRQQRAPAVKDLLSRPPSVRPLLPGQRKAKDCFMWTKTGKCNHIATCRHRHDPERVAVCRKFLLGECRDEQCALQHRLSARDQTMPVCSFFLRGLCANERCLYAHVKVNPDAQVCQAFQEGFCAAGATCTKLHTNVCQDFKATGKCPRGAKCKLKHPLGKRRRRDAQGAVATKVKQRGEAARGDGESVHIGAEAGAGAAEAGEAGAPPSLLSGSILPSFAAADDSLLSAPL